MSAPVIEITDRSLLERFLRKDPALHIYEIGDLDPFFWPSTRWFGWAPDGPSKLEAVALLYSSPGTRSLLALERRRPDAARALLTVILDDLPDEFYAHLSLPLAQVFRDAGWRVTTEIPSRKLVLDTQAFEEHFSSASQTDVSTTPGEVVQLAPRDLEDVLAFYKEAYPANWFDPRMLETGQYFGALTPSGLAAIAGIHVYSPAYRVAALGNVATHPHHRRKGWGTRVTQAAMPLAPRLGHRDDRSQRACRQRRGGGVLCRAGVLGVV